MVGVGNGPILVSPAAGVPVSPGFIPIPLLTYSSGGMESRVGMKRGFGWEGALTHRLPCVSVCTALRAARTSMGTSGATRARATGT